MRNFLNTHSVGAFIGLVLKTNTPCFAKSSLTALMTLLACLFGMPNRSANSFVLIIRFISTHRAYHMPTKKSLTLHPNASAIAIRFFTLALVELTS